MLGKALRLLRKAKAVEQKEETGEKVNKQHPYRKAWGLQKDAKVDIENHGDQRRTRKAKRSNQRGRAHGTT